MTRWRLTIEYDGGPFMGWQRQDHGPSVQQTLEEALERRCTLQRLSQRPKVRGQKESEEQSGDAVGEERPVSRMVAAAKIVSHANTAHAARAPESASSTPTTSTKRSSERPRQPTDSASIARNPIGACTAIAATKIR